MRLKKCVRLALPLALLLVAPCAHAQKKTAVHSDPSTPPARTFRDVRSGVNLQIPAGWNLNRRDGEVSTFKLDARTASRLTQLRAVANIDFNPFPLSTFSGAYFYFSVTPRTTAAQCAAQAPTAAPRRAATEAIAGVPFTHGYDEHGGVCIESRDEIYTTQRNGSCYRFDLVTENFCGGDVSGVREINQQQLDALRKRLEAILSTLQFTGK